MNTCAFYTLGCKVNQYETQEIRENFLKAGFKELDFKKSADVYVVNTCTVTAKTDKEARRVIRDAHRRNPSGKIVVTGCYVELDEDDVRGIPGVGLIVKNRDKNKIVYLVDSNTSQDRSSVKKYPQLGISDFKDRTRAFLKVQDGCNNFCSYCKVPLVRGRSASRGIRPIVAELRRLLQTNFKEVVLTGICLGAWGEDLRPRRNIVDLLKHLVEIEGDFRIRLSSIEPKYVNSELADFIEASPKICRHLHMPLQSGDDEILRMMNRPYSAEKYANIIKTVRTKMPDISITTDVLVGFPGEEESHFCNTLGLVEKVKPSRIHIFSYSKREGTAASKLSPEMTSDVVRKRIMRLKTLARKCSYSYRSAFSGKETNVLIESKRDKMTGLLKGYDDKYICVIVDGTDDLKFTIALVKIQKVTGELTLGTVVRNRS